MSRASKASLVQPPIFMVGLNVDEDVEDQWNDWYEAVHVPEVMAAGRDIISATRYRMTEGSIPFRYLAIYEFASQEGLARFMTSPDLAAMSVEYTRDWGTKSDRVRGAFVPLSHAVRAVEPGDGRATVLGSRIVELLSDSPDWRHHAHCMEGVVALVLPGERVVFHLDRGAVDSVADDTVRARVEIIGESAGWDRLGDPSAVNATLNRLFREGALDVRGDMDFAMHHWAGLFWLIDAARSALIQQQEEGELDAVRDR